ncbi:MAG: hypothetical protein M3460_13275 [Actinomycetota bacterium]|nr:hypothetical protein [Actinomycetota bacterium]
MESAAFVIGDEQVAMFRLRAGGVRAVSAICPLHNHAFRLADGQCTTGESPVRAYQVIVKDSELVLRHSEEVLLRSVDLAGRVQDRCAGTHDALRRTEPQ